MKPHVALLVALAVFVLPTYGYVYQFSIVEPFEPSWTQLTDHVLASQPFGFGKDGSLSVVWEPWGDTWNSTLAAVGGGQFFVDYEGHWRPPLSWTPQQAPQRLFAGLCDTDSCIIGGQIGVRGNFAFLSSLLIFSLCRTFKSFRREGI